MLTHRALLVSLVVVGFVGLTPIAQGQAPTQVLSPAPEFMPDTTFKGSALTGWQPSGDANWRAQNGEIVGTPTQPAGGWLTWSQAYQDVQFYARLKCDGPCNSGVLLRATKTPAGTTGMFVSLKEGDLNSYKMTLDASGKEVSRELMGNVTYGTIRTGGAAGRAGGGGGGGGRGGPLFTIAGSFPIPMPELEPPPYGLAKQANGAWDQIQIIYDSNIVRPELNFTNEMGPAITDDSNAYGPIYLYVGGTSAVHFKDVSFKDLAIRTITPERLSSRFREQQLEEFSYA
jgi:3-keto-disaccharide hydrolase